MKILDHIYAIQNIINSGRRSDDADFSNELILHYMNVARLLLFKRELDKKKYINPANYQGFCMPLCISSWVDCCDMPVDITCPILKSTFKIPRALTGRTNIYIKVSYLSGKELGRTTHRSYWMNEYSLTKKDKPGWFVLNNHLYIVGVKDNNIKAVWVDGLFEDPTDIADITTCENTVTCYNLDTEDYPIEGYLVDAMYKLVLQYIGTAVKFPGDDVNNAKAVDIAAGKEE